MNESKHQQGRGAGADSRTGLFRIQAKEKIHQGLLRLGLTFMDCQHLVEYDPDVDTACWFCNPSTGEERILLGPMIVALPLDSVEMVLRHELLHRAVYHGFGEFFVHSDVSNLALDICINRLLFDSWPAEMQTLSRAIYPDESMDSPICLCNCAAGGRVGKRWQSFWDEIWGTPGNQGHRLNPASLYFRLMQFLPELKATIELIPFALHNDPVCPGRRMPARFRRAYQKTVEGLNKMQNRQSGIGAALDSYSVEPARLGDSTLESFMLRLPVRKKVTELAGRITEVARAHPRVQPYPIRLSRRGLVWSALGISEQLHLYHNREPAEDPARMNLSLYMDVSGSMVNKYPVVAYCIDCLKEFPLKVYAFDTEVREVDVDELSEGKIVGGGGTDFDAFGFHMLNDRQVKTSVVFTDGEGILSGEISQNLRKENHRLFVVYLCEGKQRPMDATQGTLDSVAVETVTLCCNETFDQTAQM